MALFDANLSDNTTIMIVLGQIATDDDVFEKVAQNRHLQTFGHSNLVLLVGQRTL